MSLTPEQVVQLQLTPQQQQMLLQMSPVPAFPQIPSPGPAQQAMEMPRRRGEAHDLSYATVTTTCMRACTHALMARAAMRELRLSATTLECLRRCVQPDQSVAGLDPLGSSRAQGADVQHHICLAYRRSWIQFPALPFSTPLSGCRNTPILA